MTKTYYGTRALDDELSNDVWVEEDGKTRPLPERWDLHNHSPTGFEWGYGGSGPAQLALAILADAVGDARAMRCYMQFKFQVVVNLQRSSWSLTESEVLDRVTIIEALVRQQEGAL